MKSDKRTGLETSNSSCRLACVVGGLGLLALAGGLSAQQWINKPLYIPRTPATKIETPAHQPALSEPPAAVTPTTPAEPVAPAAFDGTDLSPDALGAPKTRKSEISVSTDFSFGFGQVTLPIAYSLNESLRITGVRAPSVEAASADRESVYVGGTISYSYGQRWYLDLSYAQGTSSGDVQIDTKGLGNLPAHFSIDDQWYQLYVRYAIPGRGKRFSAYLRAGATFVQADLEASAVSPVVGSYRQKDSTDDVLGNAGFGVGYSLYATRKVRFGLLGEGEGFFGFRSQTSSEQLQQIRGIPFRDATIDNTLYGGIARVTARFQYNFGQSGAFKAFAEGGAQFKYTIIEYPDANAPNELLWGPYVKVGVRYAF